jgi:hypothetical protein
MVTLGLTRRGFVSGPADTDWAPRCSSRCTALHCTALHYNGRPALLPDATSWKKAVKFTQLFFQGRMIGSIIFRRQFIDHFTMSIKLIRNLWYQPESFLCSLSVLLPYVRLPPVLGFRTICRVYYKSGTHLLSCLL